VPTDGQIQKGRPVPDDAKQGADLIRSCRVRERRTFLTAVLLVAAITSSGSLSGCGNSSPESSTTRTSAPVPESSSGAPPAEAASGSQPASAAAPSPPANDSGAVIRTYLAQFVDAAWYGSLGSVSRTGSTAFVDTLTKSAAVARTICGVVLSSHDVTKVVVQYASGAPITCLFSP
jgi:hypothetical protein